MIVIIKGLTEKPESVNNLEITTLNNTAMLTWDLALNRDVRENGNVLFRYSATGANWENSVQLKTVASGQSTSVTLPLLLGTYWAKFTDSVGNESVNASSIVVTTIANIIPMNTVETINQDPSFSGVKTNMIVVASKLQFDTENGDLYQNGAYNFSQGIMLDSVKTCRIVVNMALTTTNFDNFFDNPVDFFDSLEIFDNPPANVAVETFVSMSDDAVGGGMVWSPWFEFTAADYTARVFKFKLEASTPNLNHQVQISELSVSVELPDKTETQRQITSGTTTKTITYITQFYTTPVVTITGVAMATGDYFTISNESVLGFDINFYDSSDVAISRVFNYNSTGY